MAKRTSPAPPRGQTTLGVLAALGVAAAAWSVFLWRQLLAARAGAEPFCGFGAGGDCGALWDGAFADAVARASGLPVAAWGVVWGVVAVVLPLSAFLGRRRGRPAGTALAAVRVTAWAAIAAVAVLVAVVAAAGAFCSACAVAYLLALAWAGLALWGVPRGATGAPWHGAAAAAGAVAVAWLALVAVGPETPSAGAGSDALAAAAARRETPGAATPGAAATDADATDADATGADATPAGPFDRDAALRRLITSSDPEARQTLADFLARHAAAERRDPSPPEFTVGDPEGAVVLTEFTDTLCSHCATLHATVHQVLALVPPGTLAVEPRHFPLDGNCNPHLPVRGPETVRCLAARARICMEELGDPSEYSAGLYAVQEQLTEADVYAFAERWVDAATLRACVASRETAAELREDVDYAWRYDIQGTPLLLVDGKPAAVYPPLVYALALAGGDPTHPAFGLLPAPRPAPTG